MPRPPAWVTAAASLPPAAEPIGASRIGCWIPNSRVSAVSMVAIAAPRLALGCQLVLRAKLEIARVVALVQLIRRIALQAVDDPSTLHRRALADQVGPALDVLVVLDRQKLARAIQQSLGEAAVPRPYGDVGDGVVVAGEIFAFGQPPVEHVELPLGLHREAVDRVFELG